jgi:hypothetical protein
MNQEDVMAVLHEIGLTEGDTWTRSALLAHLHSAAGVQVDEVREPTAPGEPLTIRLRRGAEGAPFTLTFEPLGDERYSVRSGSTA